MGAAMSDCPLPDGHDHRQAHSASRAWSQGPVIGSRRIQKPGPEPRTAAVPGFRMTVVVDQEQDRPTMSVRLRLHANLDLGRGTMAEGVRDSLLDDLLQRASLGWIELPLSNIRLGPSSNGQQSRPWTHHSLEQVVHRRRSVLEVQPHSVYHCGAQVVQLPYSSQPQ